MVLSFSFASTFQKNHLKHNCILKRYSGNQPSKLNFTVYDSVIDIPANEWSITAETDKVFFNLNYLKSLEDSKPVALNFNYAILHEGNLPIACFCFQLLNVASNELGSILNLEKYGWLAGKVTSAIDKVVFKRKNGHANYILCCGSFFVSGEYGISFRDRNKSQLVYQALIQIIDKVKERKEKNGDDVCALIVKDFFDASSIDNILMDEGYSSLPMDPEMIFHVHKGWNNFDDYLGALAAKYRLRANNSLKRLESVKVKFLTLKEIEKHGDEILALYKQVQENASVRLVRANIDYFINLKKNLEDNFYIKAFFLDDKLIAFKSGIYYHSNHEAHLIGMDYALNKPLLIYQNLLYSFITDAIAMKSSRLFFGRTALEIKTTVGAKPYPLYTYFRLNNSLLNSMIKPLISRSKTEEWTPRDPFKKES